MSSIQIIPYRDVIDLLPEGEKNAIEIAVSQEQKEMGNPNCVTIGVVAVAVAVLVAGIFLILATYQIFPHGANAISDLAIWGKVIGYGCLSLGFVVAAIGSVKWHLTNKHYFSIIRYRKEQSALDKFLTGKIHEKDILVIDDSDQKNLSIYFSAGHPQPNSYSAPYTKTAEAALNDWLSIGDHAKFSTGDYSCISLDELRP